MATLLLAAPALALGEKSPFEVPLSTDRITVAPEVVTRVPLRAVVEDTAEKDLDFNGTRLTAPPTSEGASPNRISISTDGRSMKVAGEGTWSLLGADLVFTPALGTTAPRTPVSLRIPSVHGHLSEPVTLHATVLEPTAVQARASAGEESVMQLPVEVPAGGRIQLQLDGQNPGSSLNEAATRMTLPEQGLWEVQSDQRRLRFVPVSARLGQQPDPVRFVVTGPTGLVRAAGTAQVTIPIISDIYRSAPYGQPIVMSVGEAQQNVDPKTLRLEPPQGETGIRLAPDGTSAHIPGQGAWTLDRTAVTVTFTPESSEVRFVAPMMLTGGDGKGNRAAPGLLSTGYPLLVDRVGVARPGQDVLFDLSDGALEISPESVVFDSETLPEGSSLTDEGRTLTVPKQGKWVIDQGARTVRFIPVTGYGGSVTPVHVSARGIYADSTAHALFEVRFASVLPTMRDDEARTAVDSGVVVDLLANDTAGSTDRPLVPGTLRIRHLSATNLSELDEGQGKRLVMPGEGVYTVLEDGRVRFTPADGFVGRATPIDYIVEDSKGVPATATLQVDVDPTLVSEPVGSGDMTSGIGSLLAGILPTRPSTALMFGTIVVLLFMAGAVALSIGARMELDRRHWKD